MFKSKKILLSIVITVSLLLGITACGKKTDGAQPVNQTDGVSATDSMGSDNNAPKPEVAPNADKNDVDAILNKLNTEFPQMRVTNVSRAPINGYYQVLADGDVIYVAADAKIMLVGDVISLSDSKKINLTEEVRKDSRLALINAIPESDMVVYTPKGKTDYTVTVFTDIDCGYCRKFHNEMQSYLDQGIKVRYMSFPRAGKDSPSYNKAASVWCAKDPNNAMTQAKTTDDFKADDKLCDKKVLIDKSLGLVRKLGLRGTPALVLEDGTIVPGYMPADRLRATLDSLKDSKLSTSNTTTETKKAAS